MKKSIFIYLSIRFLLIEIYFSKNDESDFELDDDDIDKILIITPTPPSNRKHHQQQKHDRTGEHTPRAKVTAEVAKIIEDGLRWYEEELWHDRPKPTLEKIVTLRNQTEANNERKTNANEDKVTNQSVQSQGTNGKRVNAFCVF
jgi:hypothetical protein